MKRIKAFFELVSDIVFELILQADYSDPLLKTNTNTEQKMRTFKVLYFDLSGELQSINIEAVNAEEADKTFRLQYKVEVFDVYRIGA